MKVSRQEGITSPYVLEANDLEVICDGLKSWVKEFNFEIECKDSLKREFKDLGEFLKFENPPGKDIRILRIKGYSDDLKTRFWLRLDKDPMKNVFLSIEGDEQAVMAVNDLVDNRLAAMRPWYALFSNPFAYLIMSGFITLLYIIFILWGLATGKLTVNNLSESFSKIQVASLIVPIIIGIVMPIIFRKAQLYVFPMGVFAIGQGAKRHKDKDILRTGVVIAFAISLLSSVIVAIVF